MIIQDTKQLKSELKLYNHYLCQLKLHKQEVSQIFDSMTHVSSPSPKYTVIKKKVFYTDKYGQRKCRIERKTIPVPKVRANMTNNDMLMIEKIEAKDKAEKQRDYYQKRVNDINETLALMSKDLMDLCISVFVNDNWQKECSKRDMSKSALYRLIDRQLDLFKEDNIKKIN